jgi:hypothetical protein
MDNCSRPRRRLWPTAVGLRNSRSAIPNERKPIFISPGFEDRGQANIDTELPSASVVEIKQRVAWDTAWGGFEAKRNPPHGCVPLPRIRQVTLRFRPALFHSQRASWRTWTRLSLKPPLRAFNKFRALVSSRTEGSGEGLPSAQVDGGRWFPR